MVLHAHVPEDMKHFGKHLLATFLGLLMALGLESWREHHLEDKAARQALGTVVRELETNRKELQECLISLEQYQKDLLETLKTVRKFRQGAIPGRETLKMGSTLNLPDLQSAAWQAAATTQLVHRIPFEVVESLEQAYGSGRVLREQQTAAMEDLLRLTLVFQDFPDQAPKTETERAAVEATLHAMLGVLIRLEMLKSLEQQTLQKIDAAKPKLSAA